MAGKTALTQTRLHDSINELILKQKLDGENSEGHRKMSSAGYSLGVNVEYTYDVDEKEIDKMVRAVDRKYGLMESDDIKRHYVVGRGSGTKKRLRFHKQKKGSGRVKTEMQEKGTTIILENVLNGNADFKKETDIMKHTKTAKELREAFKGVEHLLDNWIWTFFQQQEQFIHEYSKSSWSTFEYGKEKMDFVTFFSKQILPKVSRSGGGKADAGKYTGWSPADIWAVRNKKSVQDKLKKAIDDPSPQSLLEINTILVKLMEKNPPDLVGISLKMIKYKQNAHVRLFNVETSSILKQLKSFIPLEEYTMKDIHFEPDNIINLKAVTTYVNYKSKDFSINITRTSDGALTFNTQIKGAAAQGGQTPVAMVMDMLKNPPNYKRRPADYPQDRKKFNTKASTYKTMWELVSKHCKTKPTMTWEKWVTEMNVLYVEDERDAKVTLMQIAFWYDAITKFGNNDDKSAEFWTDMLYFGMKITTKGQFAPHAKIS